MATPTEDPRDVLVAGAEQYVADLSPDDFDALVARTRPAPDGPPTPPAPAGTTPSASQQMDAHIRGRR